MLRINRLFKIFLFCGTMLGYVACNQSGLKERVDVTGDVSVLLPKDYKITDMGDGNMVIRSKAGTTDIRVVAIQDSSLNSQDPDKMKEGLELNISDFLTAMHGKLLHRKDNIVGNVLTTDFDLELGDAGTSKQGKGKFILKGKNFYTFLLVYPTTDAKTNESLAKAFFNSIESD